MTFRLILSIALAALMLSACDEIENPLPGKRISVLSLDRSLKPDPGIARLEVRLPRPEVNPAWPEAGGYANHAMQHLALGDDLKRVWDVSIGDGSGGRDELLSPPVVADGRVFTMDAISRVRAFDAETGRQLWQFDPRPKDEQGRAFGGGLAFNEGRLFVGTGYAEMLALDSKTGKEIWRRPVRAPVRGAPTAADGRIFAVTVENQLEVLAADDGRRLVADPPSGTAETAGLLGGAAPAVQGEVAVVPFSSGDLIALRVENGRQLWADNLAAVRRTDALSDLSDIRGRPVIDRGRVLAISHSGELVSIVLRTGERAWEQDIGGVDTPWVAGDFVYVLTNSGEIVCLTRQEGRVRWVEQLPRYEDPESKKGTIRWSGPVLAGDRLIVVSSEGDAMSVSPYTGKPLGRISLPDGVFIAPVVANRTLYVLTDDADLIAMR